MELFLCLIGLITLFAIVYSMDKFLPDDFFAKRRKRKELEKWKEHARYMHSKGYINADGYYTQKYRDFLKNETENGYLVDQGYFCDEHQGYDFDFNDGQNKNDTKI